jgi:hypothetical protein
MRGERSMDAGRVEDDAIQLAAGLGLHSTPFRASPGLD